MPSPARYRRARSSRTRNVSPPPSFSATSRNLRCSPVVARYRARCRTSASIRRRAYSGGREPFLAAVARLGPGSSRCSAATAALPSRPSSPCASGRGTREREGGACARLRCQPANATEACVGAARTIGGGGPVEARSAAARRVAGRVRVHASWSELLHELPYILRRPPGWSASPSGCERMAGSRAGAPTAGRRPTTGGCRGSMRQLLRDVPGRREHPGCRRCWG